MEELLERAVGIRLPNGATPTLGAFVKDRLASDRESQNAHTSAMRNAGLQPQSVASRGSNAILHLCRVRRRLRNSKIGVKSRANNVLRYYYCRQERRREVSKCGKTYTVAPVPRPKSDH